LHSTNLLRIFSKREMIALKDYWNRIGLSLPSKVNIGPKVKEMEIQAFKISQTFLHISVVKVSGQTTIVMYLHIMF
jgi:hypothetical protein